jgi:DinB superfamily
MKRMQWWLICLLLLGCSGAVMAQAADKPAEPRSVSQVLNAQITNLENDFVPAAEAMPEDKYSFAPTSGEFKGVRNFAQQVKHVAAVNYLIGGAILGEKPPVGTGGESGPDSVKSKADIVKFLKDSFAYAHKAAGTIDEKNLVAGIKSPFGDGTTTRLGMASAFTWHGFDHYGQMVEYLRMNGIIPPASRQ